MSRPGRRWGALCSRSFAAMRDRRRLSPEDAVALVLGQRTRAAAANTASALDRHGLVDVAADLYRAIEETDQWSR